MLHEKFRHKPNFGFAIKKNTIFEELGLKKCKHVLTLLQCSYATATHEKYYIDKPIYVHVHYLYMQLKETCLKKIPTVP